jgi:hypothetical protein
MKAKTETTFLQPRNNFLRTSKIKPTISIEEAKNG